MKTHALILIVSSICAFGPAVHGQETKRKESAAEKFERETLGNVPVALHGRVVDQDNQPLAGVVVRLRLQVGYMRTPTEGHTRWDIVELATNPNGHFTLGNRKAGSITVIALEKEGYAGSVKNPASFEFVHTHIPRHAPDPQNPVVFRMWRKHGAEPMAFHDARIKIPYDGTAVVFDLVKGEQVLDPGQPGDLRVTLIRSPLNISPGQTRFDWQATIEAIDGGLIESHDEFMFLAPEGGYQPKIVLGAAANDPKWTANRKVSFYIHNRGGRNYGRVTLEFNAGWWNQPKTGFGFQSFINPAGSRVLEYDPLKRIIPGRQKAK
ncbi:MAG: carboxypeptidase-like regulatory domain-containing protein [Limisphaerales bacterium]